MLAVHGNKKMMMMMSRCFVLVKKKKDELKRIPYPNNRLVHRGMALPPKHVHGKGDWCQPRNKGNIMDSGLNGRHHAAVYQEYIIML